MAEWEEYTGSDEQIAEIKNANHGYTLRRLSGEDVMFLSVEKRPNLDNVTHYLIWNPHPLAEMICQQARTGQQVLVKVERQILNDNYEFVKNINGHYVYVTCKPDWNIPNAEYSFTEFKEEV